MKALGKILGGLIVLAIVVIAAGFFLLPKAATQTQTVSIAKPAASVYALLASTPAGEKIGEGVTQSVRQATPPDTVVFDVDYGGRRQRRGDLQGRFQGRQILRSPGQSGQARRRCADGADRRPDRRPGRPRFSWRRCRRWTADAGKLTDQSFVGLEYELVDLDAQPFIYAPGSSTQDASEIKKYVALALQIVDQNIALKNLKTSGRPIAVENEWKDDTYSFYAGYRLQGAAPKGSAGVLFGQSPAGTAIKVHYIGDESQVLPTYDKMEALVAAARLNLGKSFEVYNDDPTKVGGSADREIFYLVSGDTSQLAKILPPKAPLTVNVRLNPLHRPRTRRRRRPRLTRNSKAPAFGLALAYASESSSRE